MPKKSKPLTWKGIPSLDRAKKAYSDEFGVYATADAIVDLEHIYEANSYKISRQSRDAITANTLLRVVNLGRYERSCGEEFGRHEAHANLEMAGETLRESCEANQLVLRDSDGKITFRGG